MNDEAFIEFVRILFKEENFVSAMESGQFEAALEKSGRPTKRGWMCFEVDTKAYESLRKYAALAFEENNIASLPSKPGRSHKEFLLVRNKDEFRDALVKEMKLQSRIALAADADPEVMRDFINGLVHARMRQNRQQGRTTTEQQALRELIEETKRPQPAKGIRFIIDSHGDWPDLAERVFGHMDIHTEDHEGGFTSDSYIWIDGSHYKKVLAAMEQHAFSSSRPVAKKTSGQRIRGGLLLDSAQKLLTDSDHRSDLQKALGPESDIYKDVRRYANKVAIVLNVFQRGGPMARRAQSELGDAATDLLPSLHFAKEAISKKIEESEDASAADPSLRRGLHWVNEVARLTNALKARFSKLDGHDR